VFSKLSQLLSVQRRSAWENPRDLGGYLGQVGCSSGQPATTGSQYDIESIFRMIYGVQPPADVLAHLESILPSSCEQPTDQIRVIIGALDRQTWATSVSVRFSERDLETVELDGFNLILDRADLSISDPIIKSKSYEPHLTRFFRENVRPGMTVVDVGANVGYYTMLSASLVGSSGKVIAFEPNTENCRLIIINKQENGFDQVDLYPVALSNYLGTAYFTPAVGSNGGLLPNDKSGLMNPNCMVIPTMPMSDVIREPFHFMKVDVEGAEHLVLEGGKSLIKKYRPVIVTELSMEMISRVSGISGGEFLNWMTSIGYRGAVIRKSDGLADPIDDLDSFLDRWGDLSRIEDIAWSPIQ
jgi:FkbM family methyltransferase